MHLPPAAPLVLLVALTASSLVPEPLTRSVYGYVVVPPHARAARPGEPEILRIELNKARFSSRDEIEMQVLTSANVVRVTTREMGREGMLHELGPGRFVCHGRLPWLPFFVRGLRIDLRYTATTASGSATSAVASVTL
jgi:hypothetical protein